MTTSISEADLRRMLDAVSTDAERSPGPEMPVEVLRALTDLIPCSAVSYFEYDARTVETLAGQDFDLQDLPAATEDTMALFAQAYGDCVAASRPTEASGQFVTRWQDFYSDREFRGLQMSEYCRTMGFWHELLVCLPSRGGVHRRLMLVREADDPPFSERDRLMLTLLRPHLIAIRDRVEAERLDLPSLTPRQVELLRQVASGMTNRQISRQLGVSDGTVRKHLENIYARLDAHSRTEAVARAASLLASP